MSKHDDLLIEAQMEDDEAELLGDLGNARREFLGQVSVTTAGLLAANLLTEQQILAFDRDAAVDNQAAADTIAVKLKINGTEKTVNIEPRVTLLDALRERLGLTGSKKGCDHGQCGACTVLINGRRALSCLTLAMQAEGNDITTIEGLAKGDELHPIQAAFIKHDGFQCGYCTPGQICSAVALLTEARNGEASYVTENFRANAKNLQLSDDEIRERMSGNICRCGAYPNIVAAIREVQSGKDQAQAWQFADEGDKPNATV